MSCQGHADVCGAILYLLTLKYSVYTPYLFAGYYICILCLQEEVVTITLNKYRKCQQMLEEAEHRADIAEKNVTVMRQRGRSMSVTRETYRVVRT